MPKRSPSQVPTMPLIDLVAPNAILPALKVNNKKQALQEIAARAAVLTGQNERTIFETLMQREKLGSTAVGNGIAIPHGKMPHLTRLFGLFARLDRADRFRGARRPAGRFDFPLACAGRRRRRSSEGAGAGGAAPARSDGRPQAARVRGCRSALRGTRHAVGQRGLGHPSSLRAKRSNPEGLAKDWIASSPSLLAMTR